MEKYIKRKQKEQAEAMNLIKDTDDINLRQADILKKFMKNPDKLFVINEIMNTYGVAYETARSDLLNLTKSGYLEKKLIKKKFVFRLSGKKN
jgi:Fic family protein